MPGDIDVVERQVAIVELEVAEDVARHDGGRAEQRLQVQSLRLVGRRARMRQTWSAAGLLVAQDLMESGRVLDWIGWDDVVEPATC